ncbi:2OG-Fe(II) oxygenase superfamily [Fusarium albosuccineum]|uniref:2OG-Fe(II) oxygenase superfamily n=1 Tax=Fusarium albosuccineum TaxID=1237068 RepID=A0A8H4PFI9_9HYPO|nr:2OG-Fe(II) oxygenase superfamily [Fusarium albosuccineum]
MFGTLVVSLPSAHQGGTLVLKHCGETKVFETSQYPQSFACWYSDVSHEVLPVTSGYRWVITYNLALDPARPRPSAGLLQEAETLPLRQILTRWLAKDPALRKNKWFYHVLDYDYTEANSSLRALKAQDLLRVQALKAACRDLPVDIFLGLLEKKEMGSVEYEYDPCERRGRSGYYDRYGDWYGDEDEDDEDEGGFHALEEVFESDYKVKTLVDLDGQMVTRDLHFDEEDVLLDDCFDGVDAEEEYEGYMGNPVCSILFFVRVLAVNHGRNPERADHLRFTGPNGDALVSRNSMMLLSPHYYVQIPTHLPTQAVTIVPRDTAASFFDCDIPAERYCGLSHDFHSHIGYYARTCLQPGAQESSVTTFVKLWGELWNDQEESKAALSGDTIRDVLKVALLHEKLDLFQDAAARHRGFLPLDFFTWVRDWLSEGDPDELFMTISRGLVQAIMSYRPFAHRFQAISTLAPLPNQTSSSGATPTPDCVLKGLRGVLLACIQACEKKVVGGVDGQAMIDASLYWGNPSNFLSQTVVPIVSKRRSAVAFLIGFLTRLHERSTEGVFPLEQARSVFLTLAGSTVVQADFTQVRSELSVQLENKRARFDYQHHNTADVRTTVNSQNLAKFWPTMIAMDTESDNLTTSLVSKLARDAPRFKGVEIETLWLPFLRSLTPILTSNNIPLDTPCYQQLFSAILKAYLDNVIGKEPHGNLSMSRRGVNCTCDDCERLNAFLTDATRETGHFAVNKKRRLHLHQRLDGAGVDCTHETNRFTNPNTLVVTKTNRHQAKRLQEWTSRRTAATKQLVRFDQEHLKVLLGDEYTAIVSMERLLVTQPRQPLAGVGQTNSSQQPAVGDKRKLPADVDIIDLTGD